MSSLDSATKIMLVGVLAILGIATAVGQMLRRQGASTINPAIIEQFNLRLLTWWFLYAITATAIIWDATVTVIVFGCISFAALREFITITPTRMADHRALFWVFAIFTPLQYYLVGDDRYNVYSVLIPVYAFLFIMGRIAIAGDFKRYLERCAKIQVGLMICVYCLSHAPALLYLKIPDYNSNEKLLLYFLLVVTLSGGFQFAAERLLGKRLIAPAINQHTWEGVLAGMACTTLFGTALYWTTPFAPLHAAAMSLAIAISGVAGRMTMSAIKRDRGVKDYGVLIEGHGGILDRIDAICFAAPVFYHFTRWWLLLTNELPTGS